MISVIIPAYNEEKTIEGLLKAVIAHPLLDEIIVVNDGSTDNTKNILKKWKDRVNVLNHPKNTGKLEGVLSGLKKAKNPYILLLDADLVNITHRDITRLVAPVIKKKVDVAISFKKYRAVYSLYHRFLGMDIISGERCAKKDVFKKGYYTQKRTRLACEFLFNEYIIKNKLSFMVVPINATALTKADKQGYLKGHLADIYMYLEILRAAKPWTFFKQSLLMPYYAKK